MDTGIDAAEGSVHLQTDDFDAGLRPTLPGGNSDVGGSCPTVFLSYAHESAEHRRDVRRLHDLLFEAGIAAILDEVHQEQVDELDWPLWTRQQVDQADFVLVIASPAYRRRSDTPQDIPSNVGRGVWWEADYIRGHLYDDKGKSYRRFLPVILPGGSEVFLPPTMFRPDRRVYRVLELTSVGVAELVDVLRERAQVSSPEETQMGWVFAGAGTEGRESVRGHIERRGRGQRSALQGGDLFRGRVNALLTVTGWLENKQAPGRVLVVTGQPGAGKSAVVARSVLDLELAAVAARGRLGLVFHARAATLLDLLHAVAVATGTDSAESVDGMIVNINEVGAPPGGWWRIVVDALDEAATSAARNHLVQALLELAALPTFRVVVATRALSPDPTHPTGRQALLPRLAINGPSDPNLVDLDTDGYFEIAGLVDFAAALLRQDTTIDPGPTAAAWTTYRTDQALTTRLAVAIAGRAERNYLVAALTAAVLSKRPATVDPRAPAFDPTSLPTSVGEALDKYLETLGRSLGDELRGAAEQARIRSLLTALAYARGAGITDELWIGFATALGRLISVNDLDALRLGTVADFLLQTFTVDGERVTRLFHQALDEEMLAGRPRRSDEAKILARLRPIQPRSWLDASTYAKTFAAEHAAAAGCLPALLDDPVYPTVADLTRLLPLLPADPRSDLARVAAVLRSTATHAQDLPPKRRAGLFSLGAAHLGLPELVRRYQQSTNLTIDWAHSRGSTHQTLSGHSSVTVVAVGRIGDRDIIASGGQYDGAVRVWDAATGQLVFDPLTFPSHEVTAMAIGRVSDREIIVFSCCQYDNTLEQYDGTLRVWDAATGQPVFDPLGGHTDRVTAVAIGRAGDRDIIISASEYRTQVWDAATGQPIVNPLGDYIGFVNAVALGRIGDREIIVTGDDKVRVWDATTGHSIGGPFKGYLGFVNAVALGRIGDRDIIVSGGGGDVPRGGNYALQVWDAATGAPVGDPLTGHTRPVRAVAIGRVGDRDIIVSASWDKTLRVWDAASGQPIGDPLTGHTDRVTSVAIGRAGDRDIIVSGGGDGTVRVWDIAIGRPPGSPLTGQANRVTAVAIGRAGDRDIIVSAGGDGFLADYADYTVRVWDAATGAPVGDPLTGHTDRVTSVAIGRVGDRDIIVSASWDKTLRVWDAATGQPIGDPLTGHTDGVTSVALGRAGDRDLVVSGGGHGVSHETDGYVRVWDATTGQPIGDPLTGHTDGVTAVAIGRAGERDLIVSAGGDDILTEYADITVRVWDATTGQPIGDPLTGHTDRVTAVAIGQAGDRDLIVSASRDATVRVWDATTGQPIGDPLTGHTDWVTAVAIGQAGDRDLIVSASRDATVRVWDAASGDEICVQDALEPVWAAAIHRNRIAFESGIAVCAAVLT